MANTTLEKWEEKSIKQLAVLICDGDWIETKNQSFNGIRLIQTGNIGEGCYKDKTENARYISEETFKKLNCTEIFSGDCLVSRLPQPLGRACIIPYKNERMITAVDCSIIRFNNKVITPKYFIYYSMSDSYNKKVTALSTGATRQRISRKNLETITIPLPPLPEQERIVAKLDKAFEAIDKVKANAEQNLTNAKELFESALYSLCNDKKANWTTGRLDNYFVLQRGFDLPKQDRKKGQYPLVSSNGITDFIDTYKIKRPVVVTGRSGTIGSVHYVDENSWPLNTTLYVKDFKDNVPKYIFYYLKSLNLAEYSSGAGVPTLNRNYIHEIIISFPLQSEQQKIVEKLDALQEQTKQLEQIYTQKIKECDELKQSILQKAFRGEL